MKMTRRFLAWALAIAMLITCSVAGLVLPTTAEEAVNLIVNGDFEGETKTPWETDTYIIADQGKDGGKVTTTTARRRTYTRLPAKCVTRKRCGVC